LVEPELRSLLVDALQPLTVPAGTVVIQQGAKGGDTFYVVQSGTCEVLVNDVAVATKGSGTAFGELALLYACPRAATVRAVDTTHLWVLHQRWYRLVTRSAAAFRVEQKVRCWLTDCALDLLHMPDADPPLLSHRSSCCAMSPSSRA
jgi:CRP-like cAMP-binding protein